MVGLKIAGQSRLLQAAPLSEPAPSGDHQRVKAHSVRMVSRGRMGMKPLVLGDPSESGESNIRDRPEGKGVPRRGAGGGNPAEGTGPRRRANLMLTDRPDLRRTHETTSRTRETPWATRPGNLLQLAEIIQVLQSAAN